jgi:hypothetical protein
MKLVRLINMCSNETYIKVRIGKYLSDNFPIRNGESLSPLFFNFALEYMCDKIYTLEENTESLIDASKEVGLEIDVEKTSICCYLVTRM